MREMQKTMSSKVWHVRFISVRSSKFWVNLETTGFTLQASGVVALELRLFVVGVCVCVFIPTKMYLHHSANVDTGNSKRISSFPTCGTFEASRRPDQNNALGRAGACRRQEMTLCSGELTRSSSSTRPTTCPILQQLKRSATLRKYGTAL